MMVFMNDLEDQNVSEGVGEDKEHMSVQCCNIILFDDFFWQDVWSKSIWRLKIWLTVFWFSFWQRVDFPIKRSPQL